MKTMDPEGKYVPFPKPELNDRRWPSNAIETAPRWCSVDLRDGNQALAVPMSIEEKNEMFTALVRCGFKEIEVGFPAASETEYKFVRHLIDNDLIPEDVTIQVLTPAREELIRKTVRSLSGARRAIVHLYNSTSPAQRRAVFGMNRSGIVAVAREGTAWVKEYAKGIPETEVTFQYSPESFSATEVEFSLEVCEAVMDVWQPSTERPMILNLPCTVEVAMPNVYADQIEWFIRHMTRRDQVIISVHTHNDRGTGVAATELGLLAGAERVEGTIFGNGERTGNLDIVTVALNLFTQGVDSKLDLTDLKALREIYERCTGLTVPPRHPYSGDLVFTAFSGSHQDAIRKGLKERQKEQRMVWDVPYLPIDPGDIGRSYSTGVIRVNGQSGKGGVAYLLEEECGIHLPLDLLREFGELAGRAIDYSGREATAEYLKDLFLKEYVLRTEPYLLRGFDTVGHAGGGCYCSSVIEFKGREISLSGEGIGPIDSFVQALRFSEVADLTVLDQAEHALGEGSEAEAMAYIKLEFSSGEVRWGAGTDRDITLASIKAVVAAMNRR